MRSILLGDNSVTVDRPARSHTNTTHIDARRITNICAFLLLFFWAGYLAVAGLNLLAQLSDRIDHFTALNSVHVRKLG